MRNAELSPARARRVALVAKTTALEEELGVLRAELAARDAAADGRRVGE